MTELFDHRVITDIRQSKWMIRRTFVMDNGIKVRVTIAHDPYPFQADYYAEIFNPTELKWNRVHDESTDGWYSYVNALRTDEIDWAQIEKLTDRMVAVCRDLLEGMNERMHELGVQL